MLRNVFYMGKIHVPAYQNDPEMFVTGMHEAIVTEETFNKVQEVLDGKKKKRSKLGNTANPEFFLRKFLVCPICGHALTGAFSRGNGGRYPYYNCCKDAKHIRRRAEVVHEEFAKYISTLKPNETVLKLYERILNDVREEQNVNINKEIVQLQDKLHIHQKRIQTAKDKYLDGEMSKAEKDEAVSHNQQEADRLQEKIEMLRMGMRSKIKTKLEYSMLLINNMDKFFLDAPCETKIKLLGSMFPEKIEFDGKKYRTNSYNQVLDLIFQQTNELRGEKKEEEENNFSSSHSVIQLGFEPRTPTLKVLCSTG